MAELVKIIIRTGYVFSVYNPNYYTDTLTITPNKMAYSRINFFDNTKRDNWSFNTNSNKFQTKFKLLEKCILDESQMSVIFCMTDCGDSSITLIYADKSKKTFEDIHLNREQYKKTLRLLKSILPSWENVPDLLVKNKY